MNKKMGFYIAAGLLSVSLVAHYFSFSSTLTIQPEDQQNTNSHINDQIQNTGPSIVGSGFNLQDAQAIARTESETQEEWLQYPPDSSPIKSGQWDVIEPRIQPSGTKRLIAKDSNNNLHTSNYQCNLQATIRSVAQGETELITLFCTNLGNPKSPEQAPEIVVPNVKSIVMVLETPGDVRAINSTGRFNDDGQEGDETAGDKLYTLAFTPRDNDWGDVHVAVSLSILEEGAQHEYYLETTFSATPSAPANFTGSVSDQLEKGSLIAEIELDVKKPGRYRIYANIKSGDLPIASSHQDIQLDKGKQRVALRFYGKIFHDVETTDGTFTITDVRGYRLNLADDLANQSEPEREEIPPLSKDIQTGHYRIAQFTNDSWESTSSGSRDEGSQ